MEDSLPELHKLGNLVVEELKSRENEFRILSLGIPIIWVCEVNLMAFIDNPASISFLAFHISIAIIWAIFVAGWWFYRTRRKLSLKLPMLAEQLQFAEITRFLLWMKNELSHNEYMGIPASPKKFKSQWCYEVRSRWVSVRPLFERVQGQIALNESAQVFCSQCEKRH